MSGYFLCVSIRFPPPVGKSIVLPIHVTLNAAASRAFLHIRRLIGGGVAGETVQRGG